MKTIVNLLTLFTVAGLTLWSPLSWGDENLSEKLSNTSVTTAPPSSTTTPSHWKTSYSSSYFSMDGTHYAQNNLYNFDQYIYSAQVFNAQYKFDNGWSVVGTMTYIEQDVNLNVGSIALTQTVRGLGDTMIAIATPAASKDRWSVAGNFGVNLPTGSIDNVNPDDVTRTNYAYYLQLGSGTFDPVINATATYVAPGFQFGSHLGGIFRTYQNNDGYRLGNQYELNSWADYSVLAGLSARLSGQYRVKDSISGADGTEPRSAFTEYYYHPQIDWNFLAGLRYTEKFNRSVSLIADVGVPLAQGMINYDNVVVSTIYYGSLTLVGQF